MNSIHRRSWFPALALIAAMSSAPPALAIRPLGPPSTTHKAAFAAPIHSPSPRKAAHAPASHAVSQTDGNTREILRAAQARIANYRHTPRPAPAPAPAGNLHVNLDQLHIPNLPGAGTGMARSTTGRPYSQEELTRTWVPYSYP